MFHLIVMCGKQISKPLRKLGHFNLVAENDETVEQLLEKLKTLKEKVVTQRLH